MFKILKQSFGLSLLVMCGMLPAQTQTFIENKKWGIKENGVVIIPATYDTIFNFDTQGKVCLACFKKKTASANKFIKVQTTVYSCNYLNKENNKLVIKDLTGDTCSVFSLGKTSIKQYNEYPDKFVVNVKGKKNLVTKEFKQLTHKGYLEIGPSPDPAFYIAQEMSEAEVVYTGLINNREEEIIPYLYSDIKLNPSDSLIIGCSAGVRPTADDDIYNYAGKKVDSYKRHIDLATKNFVVHKLFEPKEHYIIFNIKTHEEKELHADEVRFSVHDEILIRIKNDWYFYDLNTHQKKPKQS